MLGGVLHHVGIEVRPGDAEACAACLELLGFARVPVPESLGDGHTWLEREGTQIHLMHAEDPAVPPRGHAAVVVDDFDATLGVLERSGHAPERRHEHWGQPRAKLVLPGGALLELMAAPPAPTV